MGLAEKKALNAYKEKHEKKIIDEINKLVGAKVNVAIDWMSMNDDNVADEYDECLPKTYFTPLTTVLKKIADDDFGKKALADALKKIVIKNEGGNCYSSDAYSFDDGVLTINHRPYINSNNMNDKIDELQKLLESKL